MPAFVSRNAEALEEMLGERRKFKRRAPGESRKECCDSGTREVNDNTNFPGESLLRRPSFFLSLSPASDRNIPSRVYISDTLTFGAARGGGRGEKKNIYIY